MQAAAWNPERVGPGHRAVTVTPLPRSSSARASLKCSTYAFVAESTAINGPGWNAAVDATLRMRPARRWSMPGKRSLVRAVRAATLTWTMSSSACSAVSLRAISTRSWPRAASTRASSSPILLEAPVTSASGRLALCVSLIGNPP
jgi:hypothetical protein